MSLSLPLTVIAFFDGLASASPDRRLLPSLTVVEEMVKAELAFEVVGARGRKDKRWERSMMRAEERVDRRRVQRTKTGRGESLFGRWLDCLPSFLRHM
jgi:hypothetical protein